MLTDIPDKMGIIQYRRSIAFRATTDSKINGMVTRLSEELKCDYTTASEILFSIGVLANRGRREL